jgi:hypothetical protein
MLPVAYTIDCSWLHLCFWCWHGHWLKQHLLLLLQHLLLLNLHAILPAGFCVWLSICHHLLLLHLLLPDHHPLWHLAACS